MNNCISDNPFRILGVFSNASAKDIAGNKSKLQAYLRVNREVSFQIDNAVTMPLSRSAESVEKALSEINLPQDKIKHALFWFVKGSSIDEMAVMHLAAGNTEKFIELLNLKEDYASVINKSVYELACKDFGPAIADMATVIHYDDKRIPFVKAVCGDAFLISEDDLSHLYIDTLYECFPNEDWRDLFLSYGESSYDDDYISEKIVGKPISEINSEIAKAKNVARGDAQANLNAGKQLINKTKDNISLLKQILGETDSQYQIVADKLALQILQNGINYFNNVDDADGIDNAMMVQSYAMNMAVGKVAKDRCKENVNILHDIKDKLPPASCRIHDDIIKKNIATAIRSKTCDSAIQLIKSSFIYLQSIKAEVGATNIYYLRTSTEVAMVALGLVIDDFNSTFNDRLQIQLIIDRAGTLAKLKSKCRSALTATLYMDQLDMESDFKNNRYATNKSTLKSQANQLDVYVSSSSMKLDRRTEDSIYSSANNLSSLNEYKKLFPKGKYIKQCNAKVEQLEFDACKTTQDCENFKRKYPNSTLDMNAKWEKCFIDQCKTVQDYKTYLTSYPSGRYCAIAQHGIMELEFEASSTILDYQAFIGKYPSSDFAIDAQQIINDEQAWAKAVAIDQKDAYKDYLANFPNGRHKEEAQNKARACYIATMVYGDYNCPEVVTLRAFRDDVLRRSRAGQAFIAFYYRHSPKWVEILEEKKHVNSLIKAILNVFIKLYTR